MTLRVSLHLKNNRFLTEFHCFWQILAEMYDKAFSRI